MAEAEARPITLTDIPLLRRISGRELMLDSETALTRKTPAFNTGLLSSMLFPGDVHTLIARGGDNQLVGQLRYRTEDECARIVYIAPDTKVTDDVYLIILDALAREAGRHGAHFLIAEIEPEHALFEVLRRGRFASYARQTIWRHQAVAKHAPALHLHPATQQDHISITSLLYDIIPTMLQHVALPEGDMKGLLYRHEGQIAAYIAVTEGERGIYMLPFIHTDVADMAQDILQAAWMQLAHSHDLPLFVCIRSYQYWLDSILDRMNFTSWGEQVMMVRHIAAGVHQAEFSTGKLRLQGKLEIAPPTWKVLRHSDKEDKSEIYGKTDH